MDSILGCDLCSNHFGSSLLPAVCCVLAPCCSVRMTSFSRARLEGKALEHALAGFDGDGVRMRHDGPKGPWEEVRTPLAKAAMKYAKARAPDLRSELASAGLLVQGADRAVRVGSDTVSVDVRVWSKDHGMEALLEMKHTRQSLAVSLKSGLKKLPMLKQAAIGGKWLQNNGKPGKDVRAGAIGALAVGPSSWECVLQCARGTWETTYPRPDPPPPMPRRSGRHKAGVKRASGEHKPGTPRASGRHPPGIPRASASGKHPPGLKRPSSGQSGSQSSGSQRRFNSLPPAKRAAPARRRP